MELRCQPFVCYTDGMASPGQLVETMAAVLGLPQATVAQYDRQLSEAGLRSKGGRGRSAAKVTAGDAANLLLAILGSPVAGAAIRPAPEASRAYGELTTRLAASDKAIFGRFGFPSVSDLPDEHSLAQALATFIDRAGHGELFSVKDGKERIEADFAWGLRLQGPRPWAEILFDASLGRMLRSQVGRLVYRLRLEPSEPGLGPDLTQERFVTFRTIRALGSLMASDSATAGTGHD